MELVNVARRPPEPAPPQLTHAIPTRMVPLDEIETLPDNPRRGDVERIKASLARFGQRYPAVIRDGIMIAGNHRLQAMRELGWTHVICCDADDLTEDEARAFALADNRSSDVATYDLELLEADLERLDDELRLAAGYYDDDLADLDAAIANRHWDQPGGDPTSGQDGDAADTPNNYTRLIKSPIYEPRGEQPAIVDLHDRRFTDELQAEIAAADLPDDIKTFLSTAAERHTVYRYDRVADYYAHAPEPVRALMRRSCLVLIDLDQAIEHGFARMSTAIADQAALDDDDDA